jgi:hypothetical protein
MVVDCRNPLLPQTRTLARSATTLTNDTLYSTGSHSAVVHDPSFLENREELTQKTDLGIDHWAV